MKILFAINQLGGGGAERVLTLLANQMVQNHEVYIVSFTPGMTKYHINQNIHVNELTLRKKTAIHVARAIREEVKAVKPDCLISFEYHMNMKALLGTVGIKNLRKIISERNDPSQKGGKFGQKQVRELLYRFSDVLVCQTPNAMNYFSKAIRCKTVIIPNPISGNLPEVWHGKRDKRIVNFCRLEKQKNIPLLIDAFSIFRRNHKEYQLDIYGDGTEREYIQTYIESRNLRTSVTLHPASPEIHKLVSNAMMYVSSSDYEGISNSMLEALALGIPTICTDCPCGGARMFIRDGENGFLVRVGDSNELAQKMSDLAENAKLRNVFSQNSIKIREDISSDKIVGKWMDILK